jgi:hypothetical protein
MTNDSVRRAWNYRKANAGSCLWCKNRVWVDIHDPDGRSLGQAYRCQILGAGHVLQSDHTCDRFEAKAENA